MKALIQACRNGCVPMQFSLEAPPLLAQCLRMHPEQVRIYRAMTPSRKLELAAEFQGAARQLKTQGLRMQHPDWTDEQVQRKVRELFLYATS